MDRKKKCKAVFLDRDGTIMKDKGYLNKVSGIEFYKDTVKTLKQFQLKGFKLIGVSNQSGIARGLATEKQVEAINEVVIKRLKKRGVNLLKIYYCPHATGDGCSCRKPSLGMVKKAVREYNIDLPKSYMLGDKMSDVNLGKNAGMTSILMLTGVGIRTSKESNARNILKARNLTQALKFIKRKSVTGKTEGKI